MARKQPRDDKGRFLSSSIIDRIGWSGLSRKIRVTNVRVTVARQYWNKGNDESAHDGPNSKGTSNGQ